MQVDSSGTEGVTWGKKNNTPQTTLEARVAKLAGNASAKSP